jgi:hypothetical protein
MFSSLVLSLSLVHILNVYLLQREAQKARGTALVGVWSRSSGVEGGAMILTLTEFAGRYAAPLGLAVAAQLQAAVNAYSS